MNVNTQLKTKKQKCNKNNVDNMPTNNVNFICFYGAILSRLSYFDDTKFAMMYSNIFGNVIPLNMLKNINDSPNSMDDQITFPDTVEPCQKYVDFNKLNMPQRINYIIGESTQHEQELQLNTTQSPNYLKYISLAWSRYGEVYIVVDTRMKDCIWVIFRGTYSNKTAAIYTKISSVVPLSVCKPNEKYLFGIFDVTVECIHMIVEAMIYLSRTYLNKGAKIYTVGHSLGGAMCTLFSYLWQNVNLKRKSRFHKTVYCFSYGAPRCFDTVVSNNFCKLIKSGHIVYKRIVTRGDPVPALPTKYVPKATYAHPCSTEEDMLSTITLNCGDTTNYSRLQPKYGHHLLCKTKKNSGYVSLNPIAHSNYLNILFLNAISIKAFLTGFFRWTTREVVPDKKGNSICRLIFFDGMQYKAGFYNLSVVSNTFKGVNEDVYMNRNILKRIITQAYNIDVNGKIEHLPMNGNDRLIDVRDLVNTTNDTLVC
jgi:hypothetical protein